MKLSPALAITIIFLMSSCSNFGSDGDAADKFSSNSAVTSTDELPSGEQADPSTGNLGPSECSGQNIQVELPEDIKNCLSGGNIYNFNRWYEDPERAHKPEYCISKGTSFSCTAEEIIAKTKSLLGRDVAENVQKKINEGFKPIACATIETRRLVYQLVRIKDPNLCEADASTGIQSTCYRNFEKEDWKEKSHTQMVNECLEDGLDKIR